MRRVWNENMSEPDPEQNRFVVLFHEFPTNQPDSDAFESDENRHRNRNSHWDLMLEADGKLETWSLAEQPIIGKTIKAIRLPAHRLAYLKYEGPVSNDRGSVQRLLEGVYRFVEGNINCENFSVELVMDDAAMKAVFCPAGRVGNCGGQNEVKWTIAFS